VVGGILALNLLPDTIDEGAWIDPRLVRLAIFLLVVAFLAYVFERERSLGRVAERMVAERLERESLAKMVEDLSYLVEAGRAVNDSLELDEVLEVIVDSALGMVDADGGAVWLAGTKGPEGPEVAEMVVATSRGNGAEPWPGAQLERAVLLGAPTRIRDEAGGEGIAVPLVHRGEALGVLTVNGAAARNDGGFQQSSLAALAAHAAVAIANARMFAAMRSDAEQLRQASWVGQELIRINADL
jgi:GAF domain-containing protein